METTTTSSSRKRRSISLCQFVLYQERPSTLGRFDQAKMCLELFVEESLPSTPASEPDLLEAEGLGEVQRVQRESEAATVLLGEASFPTAQNESERISKESVTL
jgi:hypothetical protein